MLTDARNSLSQQRIATRPSSSNKDERRVIGSPVTLCCVLSKRTNFVLMRIEEGEELLRLLSEYDMLRIIEQVDYKKYHLYSIVTHSTAIEGSTITEIENQLLFDEGISVRGHSIREQMMNLDLKSAYESSMRLAAEHTIFSVDMLCELSSLVMKNTGAVYNVIQGTFDSSKGELRKVNVAAGVDGRSYMSFQKVRQELERLCAWINEERTRLLVLDDVLAKYLFSFDTHYRLVAIHPWVDGNGRMARLVMNHLQYEMGLIPTRINREDREDNKETSCPLEGFRPTRACWK